MDDRELKALSALAYRIRSDALRMICESGWGHPGGSFSAADILAALYGGIMKLDPLRPDAENRDRLVVSKAHASPALYAALAASGFIAEAALGTYCRIGGLDGHLDCRAVPGVEMSGGSLGCGLSTAAGMAWALKRKGIPQPRVYCLLGDGELCEGQIWEAFMSAAHYKLDNLFALVDYNKVMAKGQVHEETSLEPLRLKLEAFGATVYEADGHDLRGIVSVLERAKRLQFAGKPAAVIFHTVKGWGVSDFEYNYRWHTHAPEGEAARLYMEELADRFGAEVPAPIKRRKDGNHLRGILR